MAADVVCWNNLPSVILYEIFSYLSHKDKIVASSTCHNWRFALHHPSFWKNVHFKMKFSDENSVSRIQYLSSCSSRKLRNATVTFDSINAICVEQVAKIVENLLDNFNLKSLYLKPSNCTIDCPGENEIAKKMYFDRQFCQTLQTLVQKCRRLEHISLGCLEDFAAHSKTLLELLVLHQCGSIQTIGLATVKYDPDDYVLVDFDTKPLGNLQTLKILSLDYDCVNDDLLSTLSQIKTLERLVIHIHGISEGHTGTTEAAWAKLTRNNPRCELRLSLIHSYDGVDVLHSHILKRSMPLTHLRVFFCEQLNFEALNLVSCHAKSLRSIWWVDSFNSAASTYLVETEDHPQLVNPFVMCCWRCINLEELVILGYKYYSDEVYAKTRLRQSSLKRLDLAASDIIFSDETDEKRLQTLEQETSKVLNQAWRTLTDDDLHPVILNPLLGDSDEFMLPVVLQDLQNQNKAWMTGSLFKEWFDKEFVPSVTRFNKENGLPPRALLLIDNAPSHASDMRLVCEDIKAVFLPPNVTPLLQPMDQGVLQNVKLSYRKMLLRYLIEKEGSLTILEKLNKVTIKDVIYWVAESWNNASVNLLQRSWKKIWPSLKFEKSPTFNIQNDETELLQLVQYLPGCENAGEGCLEEWAAEDVNIEYTEHDLVNQVQGKHDGNVAGNDGEGEEALTEVVTHSDAANALDIAVRYVEQHAAATPNDVMFMRRWRTIASSGRFTSLRQLKITDFK